MFNGARIVGPALAGLLIGVVGLAGCFLANGLSYVAVIVGYFLMRVPPAKPPAQTNSLWQDTLEAVRFVRGNPVVLRIMIMVAILSLFGWPYTVLMPVFARDILHVGAAGLGYLMAANGVGAFLGAFTLASLGDHPHKRRLFYGGALGFCATITAFAFATTFWLAAVTLAVAGWCLIVTFATANTAVQLRCPDELRGRVMALYSLAFIGLSPVGSLMAGAMARRFGAPTAVWTGAGICALGAVALMVQQPNTAKS